MKILYVDDEAVDLDLVQRTLARETPSIECDVALSFNQAIARLQENTGYDVLLTDLRLQDTSGLDLLAYVRQNNLPLAVVVMTAVGNEEQAVAALKAGADDYIPKTVQQYGHLAGVLREALDHFQKRNLTNERQIRVLYAEPALEDVEITRKHFARYAPHFSIEDITLAEQVKKRIGSGKYDLVLLDYRLPDENGLSLLKDLVQGYRINIPVVMITGKGDEETAAQAIKLGAANYVVKQPGYIYQLPTLLENAYHQHRLEREKEALRESEERYRRLAENAPDIIYRFHFSPPRFEYINPIVEQITGYTAEEFYQNPDVGMHLIHPEERSRASEALANPDQGAQDTEPMRWVRKDGRVIWVQQRITLIRDHQGEPLAFEGIVREITTQVEAEKRIRESEQRMKALLLAIPDLIFVLSRNGEYIDVKTDEGDALAIAQDQILGRNIREAGFSPEYLDLYFRNIERALQTGEIQTFEYRLTVPKGNRIWEARMARLQEDQVLVVVRDMTEQHAAEEQLRLQANMLKAAANAIVITDAAGIIRWVNPAFVRLTGYLEQEAIGRKTNLLRSGQHDDTFYRQLWKTVASGEIWQGEMINRRKDGSLYYEEQTITPIRDEDGKVRHYIAVKQEITERKQRERELLSMIQLAAEVRQAGNPSETIAVIVQRFSQSILSDGILLMTHLPNTNQHRVHVAIGNWTTLQGISLERGISIHSPYRVQTIHLEDMSEQLRVKGSGCYLCIPLVSQNEMIGAIYLNREQPFASAEIQLASALADIAAGSIQRAALFEQTESHLRRVQALHSVEMAISASPDLKPTLKTLLTHLIAQLHVDAAAVLLLDTNSQFLEYAAGQGFLTSALADAHLALGEGFAGQVALQKKTITLNRASLEPGQRFSQAILLEGFETYIGVPLIARGKIEGVLELYHRSALKPTQEWFTFLNTLAEQAAIAIDKATLFEALQSSKIELAAAYESTLAGWAHALELRDQETEGHSRRVTELTLNLARKLGIQGEDLAHVRRGTLLHDIGKMGIPDQILLKPGPLTEEEWQVMRKHPTLARDMLAPIEFLQPAMAIPFSHHERWDGSGYPLGLKGEDIPLPARIFAVIDVWDALRSDRPYRPAIQRSEAIRMIREGSGKHFDPSVVQVFLSIIVNGTSELHSPLS